MSGMPWLFLESSKRASPAATNHVRYSHLDRDTPPAQLSSLIPACDHWCQDLCCGLCSFMEHACVAPAHCWVTSPQSMNYASSTQSHDTCSHSNPTLSFASRAHSPLYGVWVLSQPLTNNLVRVKAWPGNAASSHFRFSLPRARGLSPQAGEDSSLPSSSSLLSFLLQLSILSPYNDSSSPPNITMNAKIHDLQWQWSITLTESEGN